MMNSPKYCSRWFGVWKSLHKKINKIIVHPHVMQHLQLLMCNIEGLYTPKPIKPSELLIDQV